MSDILKFFPHDSFRPYQRETLEKISQYYSDGYEYVILESPTGSGKSGLGVCAGMYYGASFLITSQKILQQQYINDYGSDDVCVLKGRSNYPCILVEKYTCAEGECLTGYKCQKKGDCLYEVAKERAKVAKVALMNYSYFLHIMNYTPSFAEREIMILDECHNCEDELMGFVELSFSSYVLSKLGVTSKIPLYSNTDDYVDWIKENLQKVIKLKAKNKELLKEGSSDDLFDSSNESESAKKILSEIELLDSYEKRMKKFLDSYDKTEWVFDIVSNEKIHSKTIVFKPLTVAYFAREMLLKFAKKKLMMSATILDAESVCRSLGVDYSKIKFIQVPSTFPLDIRPVFVTNSGQMGKDNLDRTLPKIAVDVGKILDFHDKEKGLIHSHTFKIANYLRDNVDRKLAERLLFHDSSNRDLVLKQFMESSDPLVLVTPSMTEGIDLRDDLARFVVIVKLPFLFLGDKQIKRRMEVDDDWYKWKTVLTLIQAAGRGIRHDKDFCTTYIMDSQFRYFMKNNMKFFPDYFVKSIKN